MKLINKQPVFEAEQFDNSEAGVKRVHQLIGQHKVESWQLTQPSRGAALIVFKVREHMDIAISEGQWLVRDPDGAYLVVDSEYLEDKFDKVPSTPAPAPNLSIGGNQAFAGILKMSAGGHITGAGYEDKGA